MRLHMSALVLIQLLCFFTEIRSEIAMVFSIQRHGARNLLQKNAYLNDSDAFGGPALLSQGQKMCNNAGQNYYQRYINESSCSGNTPSTCLLRWLPSGSTGGDLYGVINTTGVGFNNYNTLVRSSALDRTVQSAIGFLSGIFPADDVPTSTSYLPSGQQVGPWSYQGPPSCVVHVPPCM